MNAAGRTSKGQHEINATRIFEEILMKVEGLKTLRMRTSSIAMEDVDEIAVVVAVVRRDVTAGEAIAEHHGAGVPLMTPLLATEGLALQRSAIHRSDTDDKDDKTRERAGPELQHLYTDTECLLDLSIAADQRRRVVVC